VLNPVQRSERPRTNPNLNPGDVGADHTTAQLLSIHCKPLHNCTRFNRQRAASPARTHCSRPDDTGTHVYLVNLTFRIDPSCKADSNLHVQKRPFIVLYSHQMAQPPVGVPHLAKARKPTKTMEKRGQESSYSSLCSQMPVTRLPCMPSRFVIVRQVRPPIVPCYTYIVQFYMTFPGRALIGTPNRCPCGTERKKKRNEDEMK
jgi:hypothetical protein